MPANAVTHFRRGEQVFLPFSAVFLCAYDLDIGIDRVPEAAFLVRDAKNKLWLTNPDLRILKDLRRKACHVGTQASIVAAMPFNSEPVEAATRLLEAHVEANAVFVWPTTFLVEGLLNQQDFELIVQRVERSLSFRRHNASHLSEAPIVIVARELGLNPQPSGTSETAWLANCPGTNHFLMIGAVSGDFGCGWCGRRGGIAELRAFGDERRTRQRAASTNQNARVSK